MEQAVACAPVTQRALVLSQSGEDSWVTFSGFLLTCKINVRELNAPWVPEYHLAIITIVIISALLE